jgi:hypothetical protein
VMEYLTLVIGVQITHSTDASKKEIRVQQLLPHTSNSHLLLPLLPLIELGTKQDRGER